MKEFIFTWRIENISLSWHKRGEPTSFLFTADILYKTSWVLIFYPRGCFLPDWTSFYLYRSDDKAPEDFLFDCEFSCVSANNLAITLQSYSQMSAAMARKHRFGCSRFLKWYEVFVQKKNLYLSQDTLTLRCRIWTREGDAQEFGQGFGLTRLESERIFLVKNLNPVITKKETCNILSKRQKKTLVSVSTSENDNDLLIELNPINVKQVKFYTCRIFVEGRKKKLIPCEHITSWWNDPCRELWRLRSPNTILKTKRASVGNKLKLRIEFIYATGERKKSTERIPSGPFKFPEFSSNSILSCISGRKLSDCPSIYKDLWNLYTKQILCDVEIKTATASFWVHKTVLCTRSLVFMAMFTNDMKERLTNRVEIEDMEDETLGKLLQFLYTDRFEETRWDAVKELYYFADKYQVALLKNLCISYFIDKMEPEEVGELLMLAYKHCDTYLKSKVEDYIKNREVAVFGSPIWEQFTEEHPVLSVKTMLRKYHETDDDPVKTNEIPSYPNILDDFRFLYLGRILSDIVVKTTRSMFPAHKAVLCAGSLTLKNSIVSGMSTNCVKMLDLEDDTVSRLLLFLYTDSLGDAEWHDATKLYHAAIAYQIERLKIKCSCLLVENLKPSNAAEILVLAHLHRDVRLELLLKDFISLHDKEIIGYQGLVKRKQPNLNLLMRQPKRVRLM